MPGASERDVSSLGGLSRVVTDSLQTENTGTGAIGGKSGHGQMSEPVIKARVLGPVRFGALRRDTHADFSASPQSQVQNWCGWRPVLPTEVLPTPTPSALALVTLTTPFQIRGHFQQVPIRKCGFFVLPPLPTSVNTC